MGMAKFTYHIVNIKLVIHDTSLSKNMIFTYHIVNIKQKHQEKCAEAVCNLHIT